MDSGASADGANASRKRPFNDVNTEPPALPTSSPTPIFGGNRIFPFAFQRPPPQTITPSQWAPPPGFSPQTAFPQSEPHDVGISGPSFLGRAVAMGGLRRIYQSGQRARIQSLRRIDKAPAHTSEDNGDGRLDTSNHYILNSPFIQLPRSDNPHVLLGYLQCFSYFARIVVGLFLLVQFILTVHCDIKERILEYSMGIVQDIRICADEYKKNNCEANQIPAITHQCVAWEICMNRDPTVVGRARVGAGLLAEVVNGFVDPLSWKTLAFLVISLSFLLQIVNALRSSYGSHRQSAPPPTSRPIAPAPSSYRSYLPSWPNLGMYQKGKEEPSPEDAPRRRRLEGGQAIRVT